jgi:hypothetical protein
MTAIYVTGFTIIAACMFLLTSKTSPRRRQSSRGCARAGRLASSARVVCPIQPRWLFRIARPPPFSIGRAADPGSGDAAFGERIGMVGLGSFVSLSPSLSPFWRRASPLDVVFVWGRIGHDPWAVTRRDQVRGRGAVEVVRAGPELDRRSPGLGGRRGFRTGDPLGGRGM